MSDVSLHRTFFIWQFLIKQLFLWTMRAKRTIAWMLMIVSIIMLTASVLPHHHHREILCLQHDVEACECHCESECHHDHSMSGERHTCDAGCITKFHLMMQENLQNDVSPDYSFCSLLYTVADLLSIPLPLVETKVKHSSYYLEKLHPTWFPHIRGLRAPPSVL